LEFLIGLYLNSLYNDSKEKRVSYRTAFCSGGLPVSLLFDWVQQRILYLWLL